MMNIRLTNTLSKKKESFTPASEKTVSVYVCGITPYDNAHIGHGRVYVAFDTLVRLLRFLDHNVTYIRNITDIDDKLINKAAQKTGDGANYRDIADQFIASFTQDMKHLGCVKPQAEPRVTECIPEIMAFIQGLIDSGHAYVVEHDVYFDISTFAEYGKLSGRTIDDLQAGARVDVNEKKRNPGDFALWKGNTEGKFWQSAWGFGRPGWHIECSVMAKKYLGITLDLHGGGMDLIFPHHENEIAQSEALHQQPFARTWMHNAFVNIHKEKMSKSLGNFVTLNQIFEHKDPMVLRFFYLQHHYRTPIDYADTELDAAQTAYKKLVSNLDNVAATDQTYAQLASFIMNDNRAAIMLDALTDDLNTPKFLGHVFEHLAAYKQEPIFAAFVKTLLRNILGLSLQPLKEEAVAITPQIQALLEEREAARKAKDWARADQIRDELLALGHRIQDKKI